MTNGHVSLFLDFFTETVVWNILVYPPFSVTLSIDLSLQTVSDLVPRYTEQETQHTNTETNISNCGSNGTNVSVRERLEQENHNRQCDDDTLAGSTTSTANCNSQKKPSASLHKD